jgi:hypothetical protein
MKVPLPKQKWREYKISASIGRFGFLHILSILVISLWISLFILNVSAIDFYPLFFAAKRVTTGQTPYGPKATTALQQKWQAPFTQGGIAYPLPLILLVTPLTLLEFHKAAIVWTLSGFLLGFLSVLLTESPRERILIPFLFLPFYRALHLGQATSIWFGLEVLLLLAMKRDKPRVAGLITAILPLKPQAGLIFALYGVIWSVLRKKKTMLIWTGLMIVAHTSLSFIIQPNWLSEWIEQIQVYQTIVSPPSILPLALVLLAACWHLPWPARVAVIQVVLFPISDIYSTLPLLFCWLYLDPSIGVIGTSLTWIWSITRAPNSVAMLWVFIITPLTLASIWQHSIHNTQEIPNID